MRSSALPGTVATGSIDPLPELATIARECGAWFHVDGAYGALASIAEPEKFAGLNEADSLSLDPHKWLYQPVDCGCLLYRDPAAARAAFSHTGDYAKSLLEDPVESFAFFEESMELSRRFRALKLWLSLRYHGMEKFREAIRNDLQNAQRLAATYRQRSRSSKCWRRCRSARFVSVMLHKRVPLSDLDALNQAILQRIVRRGKGILIQREYSG